MANTQEKYNSSLCWRTISANVRQLTRQTVNAPSTYRMDISFIDSNELQAGVITSGCYFTDYIGNPYSIIAHSSSYIDVSDDFLIGVCPTSGRVGYVHKSAYKGNSLFLPSHAWIHLHPTAQQNNLKYQMSILWGNDPNGRRIPFIDVLSPQIANYRSNITDTDGVSFNASEDYGQNPQLEVWQLTEAGKYSRIPSDPQITRSLSDGFIDSILFSGTGEPITGYILIKN